MRSLVDAVEESKADEVSRAELVSLPELLALALAISPGSVTLNC